MISQIPAENPPRRTLRHYAPEPRPTADLEAFKAMEEFRRTLALVPEAEVSRQRIQAAVSGQFPHVLETQGTHVGINLSVSSGMGMSQEFCQMPAILPGREHAEDRRNLSVVGNASYPILIAATRTPYLCMQPTVFPVEFANGVVEYGNAVRTLNLWLRGRQSPPMATINGGDKGWYQIPECFKGTGSEMFALTTARHCMAFPADLNGRAFSPHDNTQICMRQDVGLHAIGWNPQETLDPDFYGWIGRGLNFVLRVAFRPGRGSGLPGTEYCRGRDGLIRWSSAIEHLKRSAPWWVTAEQKRSLDEDRIALYAILSSVEARFLVWWKVGTGHRLVPYAFRATQSHVGGDLDLRPMYPEVTLENFKETFGSEPKWYHGTQFKRIVSIVQNGL